MVINHIDKLYVTSDAATILAQMEINHPAAKTVVLAAQMQEQEVFQLSLCLKSFSNDEKHSHHQNVLLTNLHSNFFLIIHCDCMLVDAVPSQCGQIGDGSNFVIVLAGELLHKAAELIQMGLHPKFEL